MKSSNLHLKFFVPLVLSTMVFSLAFLDPINWPKNIAFLTILPYLAWLAMRDLSIGSAAKFRLSLMLIVSGILSLTITAFMQKSQSVSTLWGSFGRNNGYITTISFYVLCASCIMLVDKNIKVSNILVVFSFGYVPATIYGAMQSFGIEPVTWSKTNEVFSFFGNANFAAAIFSISAISSFILITLYRKEFQKSVLGAICVSMILSIYCSFSTNSLQGMMGLAIASSLILVVKLTQISKIMGYFYVFFLSAFGSIILMGFLGLGILGQTIEQYTLILRLKYWIAGLKMGIDNFPWGVGFDNYGAHFQEYRPDEAILITGVNLTTNNAHNPFVQTFATTGIAGFIPLALIFLYAVFLAAKNLLSKNPNLDKQVLSIVFLSVWAMAFFSIDNIAVAILNWTFLGLVIGISAENRKIQIESEISRKGSSIKAIGLYDWQKVAAILCSVLCFTISWLAALPNRELGRVLQNPPQNQAELQTSREILLQLSENPLTREIEYKWIADGLASYGTQEDSLRVLEKSVAKFPRDMTLLDNLAYQYEKSGNYGKAIEVRNKQLLVENRNWRVFYFKGLDLIKLNDYALLPTLISDIDQLTKFMSLSERSEWMNSKKEWLSLVG